MNGQGPNKRINPSGISVNKQSNIDDYNVTGTVTLSRRSVAVGQKSSEPAPQKTAAPPPAQIAKMPYSVATDKFVVCAKCRDRYDITPEYYNTVTQCLSCNAYFVIRPPGTPPYKPGASKPAPPRPGASRVPRNSAIPAKKRSTTSGIEVQKGAQDFGVTGTVLLSRSGMSMEQRRRGEKKQARQQKSAPPPPAAAAVEGMIYSVATERDIGCPKCSERFDITPEFYNAVAECPDCACEFVIKPPGTPAAHQPPAQQSRPAAPPQPGQRPPAPPPPAPAAKTTGVQKVPESAPAEKPPSGTTQEEANEPAPPVKTGGKKAIDPLVLVLFITIVVLLVAIIIILLIIK